MRAPKARLSIIVAACCVLLAGRAVLPTEPDGWVHWRSAWIAAPAPKPGAASRPTTLKVEIEAFVPISDVLVVAAFPPGISAAPVDSSLDPDIETFAPPGAPGIVRLTTDRIDPAAVRALEFEVTIPPGAGGIATLVLTGVAPDGRTVRDAVGIPTGLRDDKGVVRHGAIEYPAASPRERE